MHAGWGALRYATNAAALAMAYANDIVHSPYATPGVAAYAAQLFNYVRPQSAEPLAHTHLA